MKTYIFWLRLSSLIIRATPWENVSLGICGQRRPRSACASRSLITLTESLNTTECMPQEQRPGWSFGHAQDDGAFCACSMAIFRLTWTIWWKCHGLQSPRWNGMSRYIVFLISSQKRILWVLSRWWIHVLRHPEIHYENTPTQIYRKVHLQKTEIFQIKNRYFSYFCSKT